VQHFAAFRVVSDMTMAENVDEPGVAFSMLISIFEYRM